MPEQARTLEEASEQLSRFDEHAGRVPPHIAAKVRAVLGEQIVELGGELPEHVQLEAHPLRRLGSPEPADGDASPLAPAAGGEFDFDLDATPMAPGRTQVRAVFDEDNPRVEDLSQFDLIPDPLEEPQDSLGESVPLALDLAPTDEPRGPSRLVVNPGTDEEAVLQLDDENGEVTLGRGKSCRVRLKDARASRLHCRVFATAAGGWAVEDMGSANGTQVNGTFLTARTPHPLNGGEELIVGSTQMRYELATVVSS